MRGLSQLLNPIYKFTTNLHLSLVTHINFENLATTYSQYM